MLAALRYQSAMARHLTTPSQLRRDTSPEGKTRNNARRSTISVRYGSAFNHSVTTAPRHLRRKEEKFFNCPAHMPQLLCKLCCYRYTLTLPAVPCRCCGKATSPGGETRRKLLAAIKYLLIRARY